MFGWDHLEIKLITKRVCVLQCLCHLFLYISLVLCLFPTFFVFIFLFCSSFLSICQYLRYSSFWREAAESELRYLMIISHRRQRLKLPNICLLLVVLRTIRMSFAFKRETNSKTRRQWRLSLLLSLSLAFSIHRCMCECCTHI